MPPVHEFVWNEDRTQADVYEYGTDNFLGVWEAPEGKTADDYLEPDGQYWMNDEGTFTPAGEGDGYGDGSSEDPVPPGAPPHDTPPPGEPPELGEYDHSAPEVEEWGDYGFDEWGDDADDWGDEDWGDEGGDGWDDEDEDDQAVGSGGREDAIGEIEELLDRLEQVEEELARLDDAAADAQDRAQDGAETLDGVDAALDGLDGLVDLADGIGAGLGDGAGEGALLQPGAGLGESPTQSVADADPVALHSGAYRLERVDALIPAIGLPLHVTRVYSNQLYTDGSFGPGWDTWLDARVRRLDTGAVHVWFGDGRGAFYGPAGGDGVHAPADGEPVRLRVAGGRFVADAVDGTAWRFDASGRVERISDRCGNAIRVERHPDGRPRRIVDGLGRALEIATAGGRIVAIADWTGRTWRYSYDPAGDLAEAAAPATPELPAGRRWRYAYAPPTGDPRLAHNLVTISDPLGRPALVTRYGTAGSALNRVVEQAWGGGTWTFAYAVAPERTTTVVDPRGVTARHVFDAAGRPIRRELDHAAGTWTTRYAYTAQGDLREVTFPRGNRLVLRHAAAADNPQRRVMVEQRMHPAGGGASIGARLSYDAAGELVEYSDVTGATLTLERDARGLVTRVLAPAVALEDGSSVRAEVRHTYDARGRRRSTTDAAGVVTEWRYHGAGDGEGLPAEVRVGGETRLRYEYDALRRIAAVEAIGGTSIAVERDALDQVRRVTGPAGSGLERRLEYDAVGQLTLERERLADADGTPIGAGWLEVRYTWDAFGRCVRAERPLDAGTSAITQLTWDATGALVAAVDPTGLRIDYEHDERGLVTAMTIGGPRPATERWEYDANGTLVAHVDAGARRTSVTTDGLDRPVAVRHPDGSRTELRLDAAGRPVLVEELDAQGVTRAALRYAYDSLGRLVELRQRLIEPDGSAGPWLRSRGSFDAAGRLVAAVDVAGRRTELRWTPDGDLAEVRDPMGHRLVYERDAVGRVAALRQVPAGGGAALEHRFGYDARGRLASVADALGNVERYRYDTRDLLTAYERADGVVERYVHDLGGRLRELVVPWRDPDGADRGLRVERYAYDLGGRLTGFTDPLGRQTLLERDERGAVTRVERPGGRVVRRYEHSPDGLLTREISGRGAETAYAYDGLGRLVARTVTHAGGSQGVAREDYAYDAYGNLAEAQNAHHALRARFDSLGRLRREEVDGRVLERRYASDGTLRDLLLPDGTRLRYTWDALGRVAAVDHGAATGALAGVVRLAYAGAGPAVRAEHADGSVTDWTYDRAGRLLRVAVSDPGGASLEAVTLLRDAGGRVAARLRDGWAVEAVDHDSLGQIVAVTSGPPAAAPDLAPWRLGGTGAGDQASMTAAAAALRPPGPPTRAYPLDAAGDRTDVPEPPLDADGDVVEAGGQRFRYDERGRLVAIEDTGGATLGTLTYDPSGRLASVTVGGQRRILTSSGLDTVQERVGGAVRRSWAMLAGLDRPVAAIEGGRLIHVHRDANGTVLSVGADGAIERRFAIDELGRFGGVLAADWSPLGAEPPEGFPLFQSRPYVLGLVDLRARVYHPILGRFLQPDPAMSPGASNPYAFAGGDPLLFTDPTGEIIWIPILVGAVVGMGIAAYLNRDKTGADFAVAVLAGGIGGAIAGSGLGTAGFMLGGAVGGAISGSWEGYKQGGAGGAALAGTIGAGFGAVGGLVGASAGNMASTAVTRELNRALIARFAARGAERTMSQTTSYVIASYSGTAVGGSLSGGVEGFVGGVGLGTGVSLAADRPLDESLMNGLATGVEGLKSGALYGPAAAVANKGLMQAAWTARANSYNGALGSEGEFFAQNQTLNAKATHTTTTGKQPDLWGDAFLGAKRVYGDVKNTQEIPSLSRQNGQLQKIYNEIPNRFDPIANPAGNKMTIIHRPGIRLPGPRSGVGRLVAGGSVELVEMTQYALVPPIAPKPTEWR